MLISARNTTNSCRIFKPNRKVFKQVNSNDSYINLIGVWMLEFVAKPTIRTWKYNGETRYGYQINIPNRFSRLPIRRHFKIVMFELVPKERRI